MVYNLIATAAFGVEAMVKRELGWLGCDDTYAENGSVFFRGDEEMICKANLWLRCAERVLINMGQFKATTFEELFQGTKAIPWENLIGQHGAFPVSGKSVKSTLHSVPNCQKIVKKAIVERLKSVYGGDWLDEKGPEYKIEVAILNDEVTLTVDTSGAGLHKRGYRAKAGEAPMKETLACAMLYISRWKYDRVLLDPMCGSGTIPIEAAMIAANIAPGMNRSFLAESWENLIPKKLWYDVIDEANEMIDDDIQVDIQGYDIDGEVLRAARENAKEAGVDHLIHFQERPVKELRHPKKYGFIITNPPYGERLEDKETLPAIYRDFGDSFKTLDSWSAYMITSYEDTERYFGRKADKNRKIYNGMLKTYFYQFLGPKPPKLKK